MARQRHETAYGLFPQITVEPLLTITVPVYNAEAYLRECLDSILVQTLPNGSYEVVLTDDNSTDGSLAICEEYARNHANVRLFPLPATTPGGGGFGYNMGIKSARGRYVGFVDCDDAVEPDMFATLIATAEAANADLTICSYALWHADGSKTSPHEQLYWQTFFHPEFSALSPSEQKNRCLRLAPAPWRKLYRRDFLHNNRILFPVGGFYEDTAFHWFCVLQAEHFAFIDKQFVNYRQRAGQQVATDRGEMALRVAEQIRVVRRFMMEKGLYAAYRRAFLDHALSMVAYVPQNHPLRGKVEETILGICAVPPETSVAGLFT